MYVRTYVYRFIYFANAYIMNPSFCLSFFFCWKNKKKNVCLSDPTPSDKLWTNCDETRSQMCTQQGRRKITDRWVLTHTCVCTYKKVSNAITNCFALNRTKNNHVPFFFFFVIYKYTNHAFIRQLFAEKWEMDSYFFFSFASYYEGINIHFCVEKQKTACDKYFFGCVLFLGTSDSTDFPFMTCLLLCFEFLFFDVFLSVQVYVHVK